MNKVLLMGRLTKDPELSYTKTNNTAICRFTLAVDRRFKPDNGPTADFINIVAWTKTAEFCSKYFNKGQKVVVVGRIQTRSWNDQEGNRQFATDVVAEETYFAERKRENSYNNNSSYDDNSSYNDTKAEGNSDSSGFDDMDDSLDDDGLPF